MSGECAKCGWTFCICAEIEAEERDARIRRARLSAAGGELQAVVQDLEACGGCDTEAAVLRAVLWALVRKATP